MVSISNRKSVLSRIIACLLIAVVFLFSGCSATRSKSEAMEYLTKYLSELSDQLLYAELYQNDTKNAWGLVMTKDKTEAFLIEDETGKLSAYERADPRKTEELRNECISKAALALKLIREYTVSIESNDTIDWMILYYADIDVAKANSDGVLTGETACNVGWTYIDKRKDESFFKYNSKEKITIDIGDVSINTVKEGQLYSWVVFINKMSPDWIRAVSK